MQRYFRLSGNGNDFLALVEPSDDPTPRQVEAWCRRGLSLGADGVFVLRRLETIGKDAPVIEMRHWNADGGEAELCLNGSRCAVRLSLELGWADRDVTLVTPAGRLRGELDDEAHSVRIEVPLPTETVASHALELPAAPVSRLARSESSRRAARSTSRRPSPRDRSRRSAARPFGAETNQRPRPMASASRHLRAGRHERELRRLGCC